MPLEKMPDFIKILITKALSSEQISKAKKKGLELDCIPFIKINIKNDFKFLPSLIKKDDYDGIIFTSVNAVKALKRYLDHKDIKGKLREKVVYAVGSKTAKLLNEHNIKCTYPPNENSKDLSKLIINESKIKKGIYFCGNMRRDTLPDSLVKHRVRLKEIVVYETTEYRPFIKNISVYEGIGFYSPSAVDSFFNQYQPDHSIPLFAIGPTTKNTIIQKVQNPVFMPEKPDTENLLITIKEYFN